MRSARVATALAVGLVAPALLSWACSRTLPGPAVCDARRGCGEGQTCVLGRCRKNKTMPVSTRAPMLVFEPVDLAYHDGDGSRGLDSMGDAIVLGQAEERQMLVLRFELELPDDGRLQRALLRLDPLPRCELRPGRVQLELAQVLSPWSSKRLEDGRWPKLGIPMEAAEFGTTPARPLMLDVTEVVRGWHAERGRHHGLALLASGSSTTGACYSSGLSQGRGPRLTLYLWPDEKDAGADADAGDADAGDADDGDAGDAGADAEGGTGE